MRVSALPDDVDARVDELYCLPLDRFVPSRSALVRALREEGRRPEATIVNRLPKPAVAAWAVNQVVRSQPKAAQALWKAGDAVLGVQQRLVSGRAAGADLREAIAAQRAALEPLAEAARGMLTSRGAFLNEQAVQAVIETLHAAAIDPAARPDVERGRLTRPLRLAGLGALPTAPSSGAPPEPEEPAEETHEEDAAARAQEEAERRAREHARAAMQREVDRLTKTRDAALGRVERRREELLAAEDELRAAEDELRAAQEKLDGAD